MKTEDRLIELENDVWALMDYLGVKVVIYKNYKTGVTASPFAYGRKVVKLEDLGKKSGK
jgi:hypothetical protein